MTDICELVLWVALLKDLIDNMLWFLPAYQAANQADCMLGRFEEGGVQDWDSRGLGAGVICAAQTTAS
jgi:hypothetical protein